MATVTSLANSSLPQIAQAARAVQKSLALTNGIANNADQINVMTFPAGSRGRIMAAALRVSATLGASATVQLRINRSGVYTTLTGATTAGGASKVTGDSSANVPFDVQGGDIVELLVGGANITAAATATVDLLVSNRS